MPRAAPPPGPWSVRLPIETHHRQVPWLWAVLIGIPWVSAGYLEQVSGNALVFTLRKFVEDPGQIALLNSINILFNFMVGVGAAYLSDHLWTRVGRRKPFLIASFAGAGSLLLFIPLIGHFWVLVGLIIAYQFCVDLGKPWEPLFNEVIPPGQRGRAGIARMMLVNGGVMFFSTVLVGQFDDRYDVATPFGPLTGEMVLYWAVGGLMLATAAFLGLAVRETLPPPKPGQAALAIQPTRWPGVQWIGQSAGRGAVGRRLISFLRTLFADRQQLWVYALYLVPVLSGAVMGSNFLLFQTDQLGLAKRDLARISLVVMPFMVLGFTPLAGFLADRLPRVWMMRIGIGVPVLLELALLVYVRFVTGYVVTIPLLISYGLAHSFFKAWLWAVWGPFVFDYVPANRMGVTLGGIVLTAGLAGFAFMNVGGYWVKGFTAVFGDPGGGNFDYSSILVLNAFMGAAAIGLSFLFTRAERRGWVRPLGRLQGEELAG